MSNFPLLPYDQKPSDCLHALAEATVLSRKRHLWNVVERCLAVKHGLPPGAKIKSHDVRDHLNAALRLGAWHQLTYDHFLVAPVLRLPVLDSASDPMSIAQACTEVIQEIWRNRHGTNWQEPVFVSNRVNWPMRGGELMTAYLTATSVFLHLAENQPMYPSWEMDSALRFDPYFLYREIGKSHETVTVHGYVVCRRPEGGGIPPDAVSRLYREHSGRGERVEVWLPFAENAPVKRLADLMRNRGNDL